ncbi:MAG: hypothetical protein KGL39_49680, partial [Patescibacteria group bacterium]|nr:hypothetical protein [Patescibacteria group bacterium]
TVPAGATVTTLDFTAHIDATQSDSGTSGTATFNFTVTPGPGGVGSYTKSLDVNWDQLFSGGDASASMSVSIAAGASVVAEIQWAGDSGGIVTGGSASCSMEYVTGTPANGVDFSALISEPWA